MNREEVPKSVVTLPVAHAAAIDKDFPERLATVRKERGLVQQQTRAERVGIHLSQLRRYGGAGAQTTLDGRRQLAIALSLSADRLVFDTDERGPDGDLLLDLEPVQHNTHDEGQIVKSAIQSVLCHEARRYGPASLP